MQGFRATSTLVFLTGCIAPEVVEADLSAPGTYVVVERGEKEARALLIRSAPFTYPRSFDDSSLEVHRFACPPGWYGFPEGQKMDLIPRSVAAEREVLGAAWPPAIDVQVLHGDPCAGECSAWAYLPSLETKPLPVDEAFLGSGRPVSVYSGCTASTVFFEEEGLAVLLGPEGVMQLGFEEPAMAAMPSEDGAFWTLSAGQDRLREQRAVATSSASRRDGFAVMNRSSEGPVGVRLGSRSVATLVRDSSVLLASSTEEASLLPTVVETERASLLVTADRLGSFEVPLCAPDCGSMTPHPPTDVRYVVRIGADLYALALNEALGMSYALHRLRLESDRWVLSVEAPECGDFGVGQAPVGVYGFRGLLLILRDRGLVVQSPLSPACRTVDLPPQDAPVVVSTPEHLLVWGEQMAVSINVNHAAPRM